MEKLYEFFGIDIGNTSISLCLFKDDKLFASKKIYKVNLI